MEGESELEINNDLNYIGSDPGAVKYGNFMNYYAFHSAKQRINNLNTEMFPQNYPNEILCLDIGCNTGELTKELYMYLKALYVDSNINILAIDIDPVLIKRAQQSYNDSKITFKTCNVMVESDCMVINNYLEAHGKNAFDVTFCFSVTMWIHLNNGDSGLIEFLRFIRAISNMILIEPQPWNCYRNAQRRVKKSGGTFKLYDGLKIRSNVHSKIESILIEKSHKKVYESQQSSWNRKIQCYQLI